jgi:hypothetical protein
LRDFSLTAIAIAFCLIAQPSFSDTPKVVNATAEKSGDTWNISVTLRHNDEGWDHYADGWGVYSLDGTKLGYRVLAHPHVNEQPFTRALTGVAVPAGASQILIRPHDLLHGDGPDYILDIKQ